MPDGRVVVVGAGLAGLTCARHLTRAGCEVTLLEASDDVGGRVRTDRVDGFLLDRGFQVLLTAYPEARAQLDYDRLDLRPFHAGALVRKGDAFFRLSDPRRHPADALQTLTSRITTVRDKAHLLKLLAKLRLRAPDELFDAPEQPTRALLEDEFSGPMVESFLRPFLAGIFLEPDLDTSSRMFEFVFKMFAAGRAAVPSSGMQAIPRQLSEELRPGSILSGTELPACTSRRPCRPSRTRFWC